MDVDELKQAIECVPAGEWAVGVSGGADSVALLRLLHSRSDLRLIVAHLDHETRAAQSTADAAFVSDLARRLDLACVVSRRSEVEPRLVHPPANPSARFRMCRLRFFAEVVEAHRLKGVLLAHHADDQAETVFQRLIRGSGWMGLGGMEPFTPVGQLVIGRPLLGVRGARLRNWLSEIGQPWREDASNQSAVYQRNRVRVLLSRHPDLRDRLIELASAVQSLRKWVRATAPRWGDSIASAELTGWPSLVVDHALRQWLVDRGVPAELIEPPVVRRLRTMIEDAASPPRQHFPGGVLLRRHRGRVSA